MDSPHNQRASGRQPPDGRLNSWKSIGAFFERDERTVRRWEAERGLPVHRVPGAGRSSVYAYTSELAEWLKTSDGQSSTAELGEVSATSSTISSPHPTDSAPAPQLPRSRNVSTLFLVAGSLILLLASPVAYRKYISSRTAVASALPGVAKAANPEARELYLQGLYHWNKRTPDDLHQALDDFTQSIVHDPNYAPAYAGLANCYNLLREYTLMPARKRTRVPSPQPSAPSPSTTLSPTLTTLWLSPISIGPGTSPLPNANSSAPSLSIPTPSSPTIGTPRF